MKLFDLKVANKDNKGQTHWKTIGTVFASDEGSLLKVEEGKFDKDGSPCLKPVGFVLDFPYCQGIITPRPKKTREPGSDEQSETESPEKPE